MSPILAVDRGLVLSVKIGNIDENDGPVQQREFVGDRRGIADQKVRREQRGRHIAILQVNDVRRPKLSQFRSPIDPALLLVGKIMELDQKIVGGPSHRAYQLLPDAMERGLGPPGRGIENGWIAGIEPMGLEKFRPVERSVEKRIGLRHADIHEAPVIGVEHAEFGEAATLVRTNQKKPVIREDLGRVGLSLDRNPVKGVNLDARSAGEQVNIGADIEVELAQGRDAMADLERSIQGKSIEECVGGVRESVLAAQEEPDSGIVEQAPENAFIDHHVMRISGEKQDRALIGFQREVAPAPGKASEWQIDPLSVPQRGRECTDGTKP